MILLAIASVIVAAFGVGIIVGYEWGHENGRTDTLNRVDRWHARHETPRPTR